MTEQTNLEETLAKDGVVIHHIAGVSMLPLLRQKIDTVVIEKKGDVLKENDVVFYKRDSGKFVLHRLLKIKENGYVIRGDNCYINEYDIKDRHILGVLKEIYRGDKRIDCKTSKGYKAYVYFWRYTYYVRKVWRFFWVPTRRLLGKIKRSILGQNK